MDAARIGEKPMTNKKLSLSAALREVTRQQSPSTVAAPVANAPETCGKSPARQGQKVVSGHFDPAVSKKLKLLAIEQDTNLQDLLGEAINDLFTKYQKSPLA
jgi:hypothetical protein